MWQDSEVDQVKASIADIYPDTSMASSASPSSFLDFMDLKGYERHQLDYHSRGIIRSSLRTAWQAFALSNING
jgi:hypothetical protein